MTAQTGGKQQSTAPDFSLLLSRMEQEILGGKTPEKCRATLAREDLWSRFNPSDQVLWARLAQMAGEVDLALSILGYINAHTPTHSKAWQARLELLALMDRRSELARVAAESGNVAETQQRPWLNLGGGVEIHRKDTGMDGAAAPFVALKERQRHIDRFLEIFSGREDCFARQWADKKEGKQGYVPVRRPMGAEDVEDHLKGRKTYGIYLLRRDATVKTAVMDVDVAPKFREGKLSKEDRGILRREGAYLMKRIRDMSEAAGCAPSGGVQRRQGVSFLVYH